VVSRLQGHLTLCDFPTTFCIAPVAESFLRLRRASKIKPLGLHIYLVCGFAFLLFLVAPKTVFAGPLFRTDDPDPVPWHHCEAYLFSTLDRSFGVSSWALPAFEFNIGAAPNLQILFIAKRTGYQPVPFHSRLHPNHSKQH
jgi:hypothetical protein